MADRIYAFELVIKDQGKAAAEIENVDQELRQLTETRKKLLKVEKDGRKLSEDEKKQLKDIRLRTAELNATKKNLNQTVQQGARANVSAAGSMDKLRAETAQLRVAANQLNLETKEGRLEFKRLEAQIQKNQKRIRDFDRSLSGSSTLVGEYKRGALQAFKAIGAGILVAVAAVRSLGNAFRGAVTDFATFERGQTNVQTLLNEFNDTLEKDTIRLIRDYGLEQQNTNKALFDAVSAGVPVGEAVEFLGKATKLAIGGVTDLGTAVDGLTSIINAYGLEYSEAERVAAAFFSAQKFGKTTVEELSGAVGQAAPLAVQLGVSYQELLSIYAELTKQGIATEEATTAIRGIFSSLLDPAEEVKKALDDQGIAYGATRVQQEGFLNVFQDIIEAVGSGQGELTDYFQNVRALVGAGALGERQFKDLHEILETVNNDWGEGSSLTYAFNLQQQTLQSSLDRIREGFKANRREIGQFLTPAIQGFADLVFPMSQVSDQIRTQQIELQGLGVDLKNNWEDEDARATVLQTITDKYPNLLAGMNLESASLEDIKGRLRDANKEYVTRIILQEEQEKIDKARGKEARKLNKELEAEVSLQTELARVAGELGVILADIPGSYNEQVTALTQLATEQGRYEELINSFSIRQPGLLNAFAKYQDGLEGTYFQRLKTNEVEAEAQKRIDLLIGATQTQGEELTELQQIYKDLQDGVINYAQAQERLINLTARKSAAGTPTVPGTGTPAGETAEQREKRLAKEKKDAEETQQRAEKVADELLKIEREFQENKLVLITDTLQKALQAERFRYENELAELERRKTEYPELEAEINRLIEEQESVHKTNLQMINQDHLDRIAEQEDQAREKKQAADERAAQEELRLRQETIQFATNLLNEWGDIFQTLKEREIEAAGDSAAERERIERKYGRIQQGIAIVNAIINTAQGVSKALTLLPPFSFIMAGLVAAAGAAQVALIASQKFAEGGVIQPGYELSGMPRSGDNTLIMAKPGEVVLNKSQQALLGGSETFRKIGVPGFQTGGLIGAPTPSVAGLDSASLTRSILAGMRELRVVNIISDLHEAEDELTVINETTGL